MQKTKRKSSVLSLIQNAIKEAQKEIDLQRFEAEEAKSEAISIDLNNGYWQINKKPLYLCSIAKQNLFDQFVKMKALKLPICQESTFKQRASEIKQRFNHVFKTQNPIENYPNIENLIFERKN